MKKTNRSLLVLKISITLLILDALLLLGMLKFTGDHYSYSGIIVYPLFLHFTSPLFPATEVTCAIASSLGLIIFYSTANIKYIKYFSLIILIIPIGITLWGSATYFLGRLLQPIHLTSIHFNNHTYNLIADPCYKVDSVCPPISYVVLKCDISGIICRFLLIPWSETEYGKFDIESRFITDLSDHTLYAKIEDQKIQIP